MKKILFLTFTDQGTETAKMLQKQFPKSVIASSRPTEDEHVTHFESLTDFLSNQFKKHDGICFVSALGICVRAIAPYLVDKQTDPAIICTDEKGTYVQSVLSGHQGGANDFAKKVAQLTGGEAIISTASDVQGIWALDTIGASYDWKTKTSVSMNEAISLFVNKKPTALLLEVKDKGTVQLEKTLPDFVQVFYSLQEIDFSSFELFIAVTYKAYQTDIPSVFFYPEVLSIGTGCSKQLDFGLFEVELAQQLASKGLAFEAIKNIGSVDIKAEQGAYLDWSKKYDLPFETFTPDEINKIDVPNPSEIVQEKIGVDGVSESSALLLSKNKRLLVEKQKVHLNDEERFTYAVGLDSSSERKAEIAIIGAGPGDEELITIKGKDYLEKADLVLYAGSLVPEEMTNWCKEGAVVRNSAMMTLEEQIDLMEEHYQKGNAIVRLHSGDPSIYGAIQEQMSIFDELGMEYFIVPGISSFNAAAAYLKSEFTIPEVVQTIIITRGEGKTPVPEAEKLQDMAKLKATLCLFLSVGIAKKVEGQLLEHYDSETPVAVLYRLTWKDEEAWTGKLKDLAQIVKDSKKTRTVLIIVGAAIGARKNRSLLYSPDYKHIFRTQKTFNVK